MYSVLLLFLGVLRVSSAPNGYPTTTMMPMMNMSMSTGRPVMVSTPATGMMCGMPMNITVGTGMPWNFPTTMIAPNQECKWNFFVFGNDYLVLNFTSTSIGINDVIYLYGDYSLTNAQVIAENQPNYQNNIAWPNKVVTVWIRTGSSTKIMTTINAMAKKVAPKLVGSYITDTNKPASFLYLNGWKEGAAYNFTSKTGRVSVSPASLGDSYKYTEWNDIFVYENGVLMGSIYTLANPYVSTSPMITLYMAKKPNMTGALEVTDYSNIADLETYYAFFSPVDYVSSTMYLMGNQTMDGAQTGIGMNDGSTPITVTQIQTYSGNVSYLIGGPMANRRLATPLMSSMLPLHLTGHAWTFYVERDRHQSLLHHRDISLKK